MKRFMGYLKNWRKTDSSNDENEYKISQGCCFFHDLGELNSFSDINDDNIKD
ncbi:MAG: hypothetical protein ACFFDN_38170 [Candidatus Hodarchaeota archaeon]